MNKPGVLIINGTVIEKHIIEQEWELFKEKILGNVQLNSYPQEQQEEMNRKTLEYVKKNIIERTLLELEAIRCVENIPYQEIKDYYQKIVKHFGGAEVFSKKFSFPVETVQKDITDQSFNDSTFQIQENIEKSLKVDKLIESWEKSLPELGEKDFKSFYENNQSLYPAKDRIVATLIEGVQKKDGNAIDWFSTEEQMLELLSFYKEKKEMVKKGLLPESSLIEDIIQKARSLQGLLIREYVIFERGTLEPQIEEHLFNMANQTLSEMIRAKDNLHLFWKFKKLDSGVWDFEHVYDSVKKDAVIARRNNLIRQKLVKLKEEAEIEDYLYKL